MASKTGNIRLFLAAATGLAAATLSVSPALSADLVAGSAPSQSRHYREVRTSHVRYSERDCQLLRVTEPDGSRLVEVCFKPIF